MNTTVKARPELDPVAWSEMPAELIPPEEEEDLSDCAEDSFQNRTLFSMYGVSVEHPEDWLIFFDPKRPFNRTTGFFRIEDYVPRRGASLSLSVNWERASCDNATFAGHYRENISGQYRRQFKKGTYDIQHLDTVEYRGGVAVYMVSEHTSSMGIVLKKPTEQVRILQLAFYDDASGRAVVGSVIGHPGLVQVRETALKKLLFTLSCG